MIWSEAIRVRYTIFKLLSFLFTLFIKILRKGNINFVIYSHLIDFLYNKTRHNNVLECPYNVLFSFSWVEQFSWHDPIYLAKTYFYIRNNAGAHLQSTKHYWIIESSSSIFRKHSWMISMRKISVHVYCDFNMHIAISYFLFGFLLGFFVLPFSYFYKTFMNIYEKKSVPMYIAISKMLSKLS